MSQIPPRLFEFSRRLLQYERDTGGLGEGCLDTLERVCLPLHEQLAPLISSLGFQTLLARSVTLASREFPFLSTVSGPLRMVGGLSGVAGAVSGVEPADVLDGLATVLAHFIWLLVLFIGENLALRKVREAWP